MGKPMLPRPMNPMSTPATRLIEFGEHLAGDAEAVDRGGDAGVDADLQEDLADLLARHAVVERAPDVGAQFLRPVEHGDHRQVQHAAGLERQPVATPHRTPAVLGDQILKRFVEFVRIGRRRVDVRLAEHGRADLPPLS